MKYAYITKDGCLNVGQPSVQLGKLIRPETSRDRRFVERIDIKHLSIRIMLAPNLLESYLSSLYQG